MAEGATERGARALTLLGEAGRRAGLEGQTEYRVVGGRIDMVWLWRGAPSFPSVLSLVGFDIESSWRTRKHIQGDYLTSSIYRPRSGVIVLLGDGEEVESTASSRER